MNFDVLFHVAYDQNKQLLVMFDTHTDIDRNRSFKVVKIPKSFTSIEVLVDKVVRESLPDSSAYVLNTVLSIVVDEKTEKPTILAKPSFLIAEKKRGLFLTNKSDHDIEKITQALRNSVTEAFAEAMTDIDHGQVVIADEGLTEIKPRKSKRSVSSKQLWMLIIIPFLIMLFIWVSTRAFTHTDPVKEAVAKAMIENPESVQAQVDLTKETLRQMGLDPGKSGDIGCFEQ